MLNGPIPIGEEHPRLIERKRIKSALQLGDISAAAQEFLWRPSEFIYYLGKKSATQAQRLQNHRDRFALAIGHDAVGVDVRNASELRQTSGSPVEVAAASKLNKFIDHGLI